MKTYEIHVLGPIDLWEGWTPISWKDRKNPPEILLSAVGEFIDLNAVIKQAQFDVFHLSDAFKRAGWEGDGHWWMAPVVLLGSDYYQGGEWQYAVKQGNNGTTFLATPMDDTPSTRPVAIVDLAQYRG